MHLLRVPRRDIPRGVQGCYIPGWGIGSGVPLGVSLGESSGCLKEEQTGCFCERIGLFSKTGNVKKVRFFKKVEDRNNTVSSRKSRTAQNPTVGRLTCCAESCSELFFHLEVRKQKDDTFNTFCSKPQKQT